MHPVVKCLIVLLVGSVSFDRTTMAQPELREKAQQLFSNLAGDWVCEGAFGDGEKITADMGFSFDTESGLLTYNHKGTSSGSYGRYRYVAQWSFLASANTVLSTGYTVGGKGNAVWAYETGEFDQQSITLNAKSLWQELELKNRAVFKIESNNSLYHAWEFVNKQGLWEMGDYLNCLRN